MHWDRWQGGQGQPDLLWALPPRIPKEAPDPAPSPLPVLIQAVDDGVALLNEGHNLLHQHLLPAPVLLCPVLFCPRRKVIEETKETSLPTKTPFWEGRHTCSENRDRRMPDNFLLLVIYSFIQ